ncbi:ZinT/AdcA family metal-binding protein [Salicibibacter cibi]|uniref:ZinT/AdcA family metal-binding protein n=1 Tax=Salicibibacter cibi TaxID=2743001 RepID=A0A7T7CG81_9BACI|nr:ZinT/AdcA family metal-binding protein [Salicibibacter cibi]QQK80900.1 ZinT/AdcA family metal-binding protein [Salicibibacter cibi]
MSKKLLRSSGIVFVALMLASCQDSAADEEDTESEEVETAATEETTEDKEATEEGEHDHDHDHESEENAEAGDAEIEGFIDHYHTGDTVELTATTEEDEGDGHWHWYIRGGEEGEWEEADGGDGDTFEAEAVNHQQIKATLYDDDHEVISETEPVTVIIDDHDGDVYEGYFDDEDVEDRDISDWAGEWKSVYPYFQEGELDEVFEHRAEESDDMSVEDYEAYYETGYATSVDNIEITEDGEFTFHDDDETYSGTYDYDGYEILEYEAGNRGVRYIFELDEGDDDAPQNIQFSDHIIAPQPSSHFHIYWGDDRDELLDEVDHWPTYYPVDWSVDQIVDDLLLH